MLGEAHPAGSGLTRAAKAVQMATRMVSLGPRLPCTKLARRLDLPRFQSWSLCNPQPPCAVADRSHRSARAPSTETALFPVPCQPRPLPIPIP